PPPLLRVGVRLQKSRDLMLTGALDADAVQGESAWQLDRPGGTLHHTGILRGLSADVEGNFFLAVSPSRRRGAGRAAANRSRLVPSFGTARSRRRGRRRACPSDPFWIGFGTA